MTLTPADLATTSSFVPVVNGALHVVEHAPLGPSKGTVVLVHGFPETWWSWRHQIFHLARDHQVVAVDVRGFGASSTEGPFDLETLAADVAAVIRARGGRATVIGHDWGGAITWTVAALHPELVERVVVLNCPVPDVLQEQLVRRPSREQLRRSWYIFFFQLPLVPEWLIGRRHARAVVNMMRKNARHHDHMSDAELEPIRAAAETKIKSMLGPYRAALALAFRTFRPPPVAQPSLLIWGVEDPALSYDVLVPPTIRRCGNLRVEPLAGVGHFPQAEVPEVVNALIDDFLANAAPGRG